MAVEIGVSLPSPGKTKSLKGAPSAEAPAGARELGVNLDALAQYLGGTITSGNTITFPGPDHSSTDRSASITFTNEAWNGIFKTHSYANKDEVPGIERAVMEALYEIGWDGQGIEALKLSADDKKEQGRNRARWMWGFGTDPAGTPVEAYLKSRCLRLPPPGDQLKYWRFGRFGQAQNVPLMLAAVRDISTDEGIAVHRTALDLEGRKAYLDLYGNLDCRAFTGAPKGGAIKLFPLGPRLGVGEGLETTLSLREMKGDGDLPVWSMMSDLGLAGLPVLEGVKELIVAGRCRCWWHEVGAWRWLPGGGRQAGR